jgi:hypothetical protein
MIERIISLFIILSGIWFSLISGLDVPSVPLLNLTVISDKSILNTFNVPESNGGSAINSYKVNKYMFIKIL